MKYIILIFLILIIKNVSSQEKKDTSINLWNGDVKTEILDEIVFVPISKKEVKDIIKKINSSLESNYKKNDGIYMTYDEKIVANDSIENSISGNFGVLIPNYTDINIQDIEIAKIYSLTKAKIVGKEQPINAASAPFVVPTMGFVLPIVSIADAPFVESISDYKYSGWSDEESYIISFEPEDYQDSYKFCGKIVINKKDYSIININYELCSKNNIMKLKDLPYLSNKLSFSQKFKIQALLLFAGSVRRFSNNLLCNTLYWKTDIGYRKDLTTGKYTLDYVSINSSSIVKGKVEEELLEKVTNKQTRDNLEGKEYIDVIQKYQLNVNTYETPFKADKDNVYLNAIFYDIYEEKNNNIKDYRKGGVKKYYEKIEILEKALEKK